MKPATFTNHARRRVGERCGLSQEELKRILDAGGGVAIHLQKGGRYAHRLIYSHRDEDWFMVVQDGGDGGVLTVMPLEFLKGRTPVTAAHKRQARRKAIDALAAPAGPAASGGKPAQGVGQAAKAIEPTAAVAAAAETPKAPQSAWRIRVRYKKEGKPQFKMLPRVPVDYGEPNTWLVAGPIHNWLRERLIEEGVPFAGIECIMAVGRKQDVRVVDELMEHLPLTEEEVESCR